VLIVVRWIPFLLGASFLVNAVKGKWAFSPNGPNTSAALIALDVLLGLVCLAWAWWLRQRRLQRIASRDQWAAYGQARHAQDRAPADRDP
jgi:hypothetical protein